MTDDEAEIAESFELVRTPLGEPWSGRTRYAAAMTLYKCGLMTAEALEVYRLCSQLDSMDPLPIIRDRGAGREWLKTLAESGGG